jgi:hypothetical protein
MVADVRVGVNMLRAEQQAVLDRLAEHTAQDAENFAALAERIDELKD